MTLFWYIRCTHFFVARATRCPEHKVVCVVKKRNTYWKCEYIHLQLSKRGFPPNKKHVPIFMWHKSGFLYPLRCVFLVDIIKLQILWYKHYTNFVTLIFTPYSIFEREQKNTEYRCEKTASPFHENERTTRNGLSFWVLAAVSTRM